MIEKLLLSGRSSSSSAAQLRPPLLPRERRRGHRFSCRLYGVPHHLGGTPNVRRTAFEAALVTGSVDAVERLRHAPQSARGSGGGGGRGEAAAPRVSNLLSYDFRDGDIRSAQRLYIALE